MVKLPRSPDAAHLRSIGPQILPSGALGSLWRVYFRGGVHPCSWSDFRVFGPLSSRFDHHLPDSAGGPRRQKRGVAYLGESGITCLGEVFQKNREINRLNKDPWLASFRPIRELNLLDLTGRWATKAGASAAIGMGPKGATQEWARAFYAAYRDIDGLAYPSSMVGKGIAVALFERAADAMPTRPETNRSLADPLLETLLENAADDIGYKIVGRR